MSMTFGNAVREAKNKGFIVVVEGVGEDDYDLEDFIFSVLKNGEIVYGFVNYETIRAFLFGLYAPFFKED